MIKRSWVEVNLDVIINNFRIFKKQIDKNYEIMAVVKADAYGHGDTMVASVLQEKENVKSFAVSNIEEAINLRKAGIKGQILILGYTPSSLFQELKNYDITQALLSEEYADKFAEKGIKAQFAIDTGMNRIGLDADNPESCSETIHNYAGKFNLTGIFTHLCVADTPAFDEFTSTQIAKFRNVADKIKDLHLPYVHCMNSAGSLRCNPYGDMVRLGIVLYGLKPDYKNILPDGIKPALTWKTTISMVKNVFAGESVGYGCSFTATHDMRIATLPTGYADGYNRLLSDKGHVIIQGHPAKIIGRICMDQMMVDVTDIPDASFEDEVILVGDAYTADDMAHDIGTIGYEIVCDISKRVPKVYIGN